MNAKEKAKTLGVELRGRLFSGDNLCPSISKIKLAEKENINKMIKLENKINAQIEKKEGGKEGTGNFFLIHFVNSLFLSREDFKLFKRYNLFLFV